MKNITIAESKIIQLDILQAIHDFCVQNNIKYSICGGTLIGAVRHKGFIPWDDDIDIFMLREDYVKFSVGFKHKLYKFHCLENDSLYCYPFGKVEDTRTLVDENVSGPKMGISVDVFPVDNCYDSVDESILFINSMKGYQALFKGKLVKPGKNNSFSKKIAILSVKLIVLFNSLRSLAEKLSSKCQMAKHGSKYVATTVSGYGVKELQLRSNFDETILLPFEDREFMAISNYDSYLKSVYGDYMQLPPVDKRRSPHTLDGIYWK